VATYFLDTNVLSEVVRPRPDRSVLEFLAAERDVWISVIVFHEFEFGMERLQDPDRRANLRRFHDATRARYEDWIVPVDIKIAELGGQLRGQAARLGRVLHAVDSLIGATALASDATLATRNTRDFDGLGVKLINPWETRL